MATAWDMTSEQDKKLIEEIAERVFEIDPAWMIINAMLDLAVTHRSYPLALAAMIEADVPNLMHDIYGINVNLDHETGELQNCFLPRFARKLA